MPTQPQQVWRFQRKHARGWPYLQRCERGVAHADPSQELHAAHVALHAAALILELRLPQLPPRDSPHLHEVPGREHGRRVLLLEIVRQQEAMALQPSRPTWGRSGLRDCWSRCGLPDRALADRSDGHVAPLLCLARVPQAARALELGGIGIPARQQAFRRQLRLEMRALLQLRQHGERVLDGHLTRPAERLSQPAEERLEVVLA
eukprot:CAMPEP_0119390610 /NCGR_PEP_ID=MMETSP1334-20130426/113995_1 /TAXON_ID=127549 /ORGANISM="Calcidiscus leptoporus, Strain RCC1130" /LENGTH=203 /DNA_ID=CAMNT_0007413145 /DNA_START=51 /DNA_END=662 /DNA_ORIENTATION=+